MSYEIDSRKSLGPYILDMNGRSCWRDGRSLDLDPQEFALLSFFIEHNGDWVKKEDLFDAFWPDENTGADGRLRSALSVLKRKLGSPGREYFETKWKTGYRFKADVRDLATIPDEACPWLGLRSIDEEHSESFCGRVDDVYNIIAKLNRHNFLAVTSLSGIGKSSLVRAGLIPALKQRAESDNRTFTYRVFTPKQSPLRQLAKQTLTLTGALSTPDALQREIEFLASTPEGLQTRLNTVSSDRILLVVDQFEECENSDERDIFIINLLNAVRGLNERLWVVLTLRTDFYSKFELTPIWSELSQNQYGIAKLSRDQLREAIEEPARSVHLKIDEGLVDEILNDLGDGPAALPLLSHTMAELFKQRDGTRLTLLGYQSTGRVGRAIAKHADAVYKQFSEPQQAHVRSVMLELTQAGDKSEHDVRRSKLLKDLIGEEESEDLEAIIRKLSDERLLIIERQQLEDSVTETVEICHEALIQHWPTLKGWLDEGRDTLIRFERFNSDARAWQESNKDNETDRDRSLLYSGLRLKEALEIYPTYARLGLMANLHFQFIDASESQAEAREEVERRRRITRRRWKAIGLALLILVVLFIGLFIGAKRQRDRAEARRLSSDSVSQLKNDPELSLLLAIEAARFASTEQTDSALRRALASLFQRATYLGHQKQVISLDVSPDGQHILTGGADSEARIWDIHAGTTVKKLTGHSDWINWAAYSHDGKRIVTAGRDGRVLIWNAATAQVINELKGGHTGSVQNAVFSPDGKLVLTAGEDSTARVWDAETGKEIMAPLQGHSKWINTAVFSPDGNLIATASGDGTARIWNAKTGKVLTTLTGHGGTVLGVAFDTDGQRLITTSSDKTARVWRVADWKMILELPAHNGPVNSGQFSSDGKWILTASKDGTAKLWDANSGLELETFHGHRSGINAAVFSIDGNFVFTASGDGTARMWAIQFGQRLGSLNGHSDVVVKSTFSADGKWIATASHDKTARIWDAHTLQQTALFQHPDLVDDIAFSPDGTLIATVSHDGKGRLWNVSSGNVSQELVRQSIPRDRSGLTSVAFSSDGARIVTGAQDGTVQVWETQSGRILANWQAHWRASSQGPEASTLSVVFSPRDEFIATSGSDNAVRLWNASDWKQKSEWEIGTGQINTVAFSPNGQYLVGACQDQTARVWNISDKQTMAVLRGHDQSVVSATFSPNAALLLTTGRDKTARLWELGANEVLSIFAWNADPLTAAYFSPNGRTIAISDTKGVVQLYSCDICAAQTSELLSIAQDRRTRELTPSERQRFLSAE